MKKERSKDELELGDLVMFRGNFGTVVKKRREHVSSYGPALDVCYDVLFNEDSQMLTAQAIPYAFLKFVQEAE